MNAGRRQFFCRKAGSTSFFPTRKNSNERILDRFNPLLVQLLPPCIKSQLVKEEMPFMCSMFSGPLSPLQNTELIQLSRIHLEKHDLFDQDSLKHYEAASDGITFTKERASCDKDALLASMKLPAIIGSGHEANGMDLHFKAILRSIYKDNIGRAQALASCNLPEMPSKEQWRSSPGWTRYSQNSDNSLFIENISNIPADEDIVFDVEVSKNDPQSSGLGPTLAAAASSKAWYIWLSPRLLSEDLPDTLIEDPASVYNSFEGDLIPLGTAKRLIVGHNVAFDRVRIKEEYSLLESYPGNFFIDTLSLHSCIGGLSGQQRSAWMKWKKETTPKEASTDLLSGQFIRSTRWDERWAEVSSKNSLKDCLAFYCRIDLEKEVRNLFVNESLNEVRRHLTECIDYCAKDVFYTHKLLKAIWPKYLAKCPSALTTAGLFLLGKTFLTTSTNWLSYVKNCDSLLFQSRNAIQEGLIKLMEETAQKYQINDAWRSDPWLSHLNWEPIPVSYTKGTIRKKRAKVPMHLYSSAEYLAALSRLPDILRTSLRDDDYYAEFPRPKVNPKLFGKPKWYKMFWCDKREQLEVSPGMSIVPLLLRLKWKGAPVFHTDQEGWQYEVPPQKPIFSDGDRETSFDRRLRMQELPVDRYHHGGRDYIKIPQLDSSAKSKSVGSLFSKAFMAAHTDGDLRSDEHAAFASLMMESYRKTAFWNSIRSRCYSQLLVCRSDLIGFEKSVEGEGGGVILPHLIPMGTVSRRAVEPLWLTATNASMELVGSELKRNIVAPEGWKIVGADVDSQELWLASLFGDKVFGQHGATALSWMNLLGDKASGTDVHSKTCRILGINRNQAKVFNYGRIYGAGVSFATSLLTAFTDSEPEASAKASELYAKTKGKRIRLDLAEQPPFLADLFDDGASEARKFFQGGTESFMFNELERQAHAESPRTALSQTCISNALQSAYVGDQFMTSRINWMVQSAAVDYLHALLISVDYLTKLYAIPCRLLLSIHDEVRFLVKEAFQYELAFILQVANCWTRLYFAQQMGLKDLPLSVAFFSAVDIDFVLRKEVTHPCTSPSQPSPLLPAESLDIHQLLAKINTLGPIKNQSLWDNLKEAEQYILAKLPSYTPPKALLHFQELCEWIRLQDQP